MSNELESRLNALAERVAFQFNSLPASSSSQGILYSSDTYTEVADADAVYQSWERTDGTGYLAQRVELANNSITEATGTLPVPDLTTLTYS